MMHSAQTIYSGVNGPVLSFVPQSADRVLDIGCGTGTFGQCLRQQRERYVVGITYSQEEAKLASTRLSRVYCADLNVFDLKPLGQFDCVVMSHVLEHLYAPVEFLERVKSVLTPDGVIVVALPNVVWWRQRIQFLAGRWRYQDSGILDRTHYRFFDKRSSRELLEDAGFTVLRRGFDGRLPFMFLRPMLGRLASGIERLASEGMPGLLAMQFIYLAKRADGQR